MTPILNKVANRLEALAHTARPYVPFTTLNTVRRNMDKGTGTVLDLGCGNGEPMEFINRKRRFFALGVDVFRPYLRECRKTGTHEQYVLCDVRHLPFKSKSFDVVLCMEMLEHLTQSEGKQLLEDMEEIARSQVIATTPAGCHSQREYDNNPYQEHRHIWKPAELRQLGYKVRGQGVRNLGGKSGIQSPLPKALRALVVVLWVAAGPVTYFFPSLGGSMVGVKDLRSSNGGIEGCP